MDFDDIMRMHPDTEALAEALAAQLSHDEAEALKRAEAREDIGGPLTARFLEISCMARIRDDLVVTHLGRAVIRAVDAADRATTASLF